jgi:hypothetical protein
MGLPEEPFAEFPRQLRQSHDHGGAHLVALEVSADPIIDWFASRNRPSDEDLIDSLLIHPTVRAALPDLAIPESKVCGGRSIADPFLLDGTFSHLLHHGGAYWTPKDSGKSAKSLAATVCDAMFGLRWL